MAAALAASPFFSARPRSPARVLQPASMQQPESPAPELAVTEPGMIAEPDLPPEPEAVLRSGVQPWSDSGTMPEHLAPAVAQGQVAGDAHVLGAPPRQRVGSGLPTRAAHSRHNSDVPVVRFTDSGASAAHFMPMNLRRLETASTPCASEHGTPDATGSTFAVLNQPLYMGKSNPRLRQIMRVEHRPTGLVRQVCALYTCAAHTPATPATRGAGLDGNAAACVSLHERVGGMLRAACGASMRNSGFAWRVLVCAPSMRSPYCACRSTCSTMWC